MIHELAKGITFFLKNDGAINDNEEIYQYGIEVVISNIVGTLCVIVCSLIMNKLVYGLTYILLFAVLRTKTGGYHADTYVKCNTMFCCIFVLSVLFSEVAFNNNLICLMWLLTVCGFMYVYAYAPVEHKDKPMSLNEKKRCRVISIAIYLLLIFIILYMDFGLGDFYLMNSCLKYSYYIKVILISIVALMIVGGVVRKRSGDGEEKL